MQTVLRRYQEPRGVRVPVQQDDQEHLVRVSPTLVSESEVGALYYDREADRWIVDLDQMGVTLHFASGEFDGFLQLLAAAAGRDRNLLHGVTRRSREHESN